MTWNIAISIIEQFIHFMLHFMVTLFQIYILSSLNITNHMTCELYLSGLRNLSDVEKTIMVMKMPKINGCMICCASFSICPLHIFKKEFFIEQ